MLVRLGVKEVVRLPDPVRGHPALISGLTLSEPSASRRIAQLVHPATERSPYSGTCHSQPLRKHRNRSNTRATTELASTSGSGRPVLRRPLSRRGGHRSPWPARLPSRYQSTPGPAWPQAARLRPAPLLVKRSFSARTLLRASAGPPTVRCQSRSSLMPGPTVPRGCQQDRGLQRRSCPLAVLRPAAGSLRRPG